MAALHNLHTSHSGDDGDERLTQPFDSLLILAASKDSTAHGKGREPLPRNAPASSVSVNQARTDTKRRDIVPRRVASQPSVLLRRHQTMTYRLTFKDAIEVWLRSWRGEFQHQIAALFGVNQGRVNEVLKERVHIGSKKAAETERSD